MKMSLSALEKQLSNIIVDGVVSGNEIVAIQTAIEYLKDFEKVHNQLSSMSGLPVPDCSARLEKEFSACCFNCGTRLDETDKFCSECGAHFTQMPVDMYRCMAYLNTHDIGEICNFCNYRDGCPNDVVGGPNGPIYPKCSDLEWQDYMDLDALIRYINSEQFQEDEEMLPETRFIEDFKRLQEKYQFAFWDRQTYEEIERDLYYYADKYVTMYQIRMSNPVGNLVGQIYLGDAPRQVLSILPYYFNNMKYANDRYTVFDSKGRAGTVRYYGKWSYDDFLNGGLESHMGFKTSGTT